MDGEWEWEWEWFHTKLKFSNVKGFIRRQIPLDVMSDTYLTRSRFLCSKF